MEYLDFGAQILARMFYGIFGALVLCALAGSVMRYRYPLYRVLMCVNA
jgi:hypothetical protein